MASPKEVLTDQEITALESNSVPDVLTDEQISNLEQPDKASSTVDILKERDSALSINNLRKATTDILSGNFASQAGGGALLEGLLREEAAVAQPALNLIRSSNPTFGQEKPGTPSEGFLEGIKGNTFSKFKQGEQAQLGDILREFNVPEPVSAIGGLVASGLLPSSVLGGRLVGASGKVAKKTSSVIGGFVNTVMGKNLTQAKKVPVGLADDLVNTFRNLDKEAKAGKEMSAEIIESLTNIKSDEVLYAFDNPEILTRANARPEMIKDIANESYEAISALRKSGSTVLSPPDELPLEIARNITETFDSSIKSAGIDVTNAKESIKDSLRIDAELTGKVRGINSGQLSGQIDLIMDKFGFLDESGKVKPAFKDSKAVSALKNVKRIIKDTSDVPGEISSLLDSSGKAIIKKEPSTRVLEFGDLLDIKKSIQDVAFTHSVAGADGILRPIPQVESALRKVNGIISNTVKSEFSDFPKLQQAFDKFSKFADLRTDISSKLKTPEKLAKFIRRIDKTNLEDMEELSNLISVLPNRGSILNDLKKYTSMKENSIVGRLGITNVDSKSDVVKKLESILSKPLTGDGAISTPIQEGIVLLERASGKPISRKLLNHKVAKSFSQKSNFFRALAAGSIIGVPGVATGNPGAAALGFLSGLALTDPRIQGKVIKTGGNVKKFINKPTTKFVTKSAVRGVGRKSVEDFLDDDN